MKRLKGRFFVQVDLIETYTMIPAAPLSFLFLFVILSPLIWVVFAAFALYILLKIFYQRVKFGRAIKSQLSKKRKIFFSIFVLLSAWTAYIFTTADQIRQELNQKENNKIKRSQFILPVDYKFDEFIFPQGSKINLDNVHDNGEQYRYLTLTELEAVIFPRPVLIAGVRAIAFRQESGNSFLLQLSEDQKITPVYKSIYNKEKQIREIKVVKASEFCQKGQMAEFIPIEDYYPNPEYDEAGRWITLEDEKFAPSEWRFTGCFNAPAIYLRPMYPIVIGHFEQNQSHY